MVAMFVVAFAINAVTGPDLFILLSTSLAMLALAITGILLLIRIVFYSGRIGRLLPFCLIALCLSFRIMPYSVDVHLIASVYMAGGPNQLNDWAQSMISEYKEGRLPEGAIEIEKIPSSIRNNISGHATVGGTIWSDETRVRFERGGGFYHFGIVIYSTDSINEHKTWQRLLGWPAEVVIYREE